VRSTRDIGNPKSKIQNSKSKIEMSDAPRIPPRPADGHKGTFGTVCVVGGQAGGGSGGAGPRVMVGGPAFAALGALRSGCGLAVLAVPMPVMAAALVIAPGATGLALPVDENGALKPSDIAHMLDQHMLSFRCLALGPGFGAEVPQQQVVARLVAQDEVPLVIDADALNCLANLPQFHRDMRAASILTPHPGEFARLAKTLGFDADAVDPKKRPAAAEELARRLGCVVVLKGHGTIITDGVNTHVNATGNVALATAGTGDVLTGIIAGFVAQFFKPSLGNTSRQITAQQQGGLSLLDCARLATHLHGLGADRWAAQHGNAGMTALDLLNEVPDALRAMRA
jgi:NAD(P)H-hydrate epimerase